MGTKGDCVIIESFIGHETLTVNVEAFAGFDTGQTRVVLDVVVVVVAEHHGIERGTDNVDFVITGCWGES